MIYVLTKRMYGSEGDHSDNYVVAGSSTEVITTIDELRHRIVKELFLILAHREDLPEDISAPDFAAFVVKAANKLVEIVTPGNVAALVDQQLANIRATLLDEAEMMRDAWGFTGDSGYIMASRSSDHPSRAVAYGRWRALVEMIDKLDRRVALP